MFRQSFTKTSFLLLMLCLCGTLTYHVRSKRQSESDEKIAVFMRETLDDFKGMMKTGFKPLGIPVMDPLKGEDSDLEIRRDRITVNSKFTELLIYGISTFDITEMKVTRSDLQMTFAMKFPKLDITGLYDMTGSLGRLLSIRSNGNFEAYATDVLVAGIAALMEKSNNGYLYIESLNLDMNVEGVEIHFHNSRGDTPLSGPLDAIINLYGKQIFEAAKPRLIERLESRLVNMLNSTLASYNVL